MQFVCAICQNIKTSKFIVRGFKLQVESMVVTEKAVQTLSILFAFIKSWFQQIESIDEFNISLAQFNKILKINREVLGEHTSIVVERFLSNLLSKEKYLFHYNFINRCTFGFTGDSIVEASFSALKRSHIAVNSKKTIDFAGMGIIAQNDEKVTKLNSEHGGKFDREVLWSKCTVKDILTKYALGLFCKNFDQRDNYIICEHSQNRWLVTHRSSFESRKNEPSEVTKFIRIREIVLTDQAFLQCSCGRTTQYMIPCTHICKLVNNEEHFGPYQFHVRWHKNFAYLHNSNFGEHISKQSVELFKDILKETREKHFDEMGRYKGVPMLGSSFLQNKDDISANFTSNTEEVKFMRTLHERQAKLPHVRGTICLETFEDSQNGIEVQGSDEESGNHINFSILTEEEFDKGGSEFDRSQHTEDDDSFTDAYDYAHPLFEEATRCIMNRLDADDLRITLTQYIQRVIFRNGMHSQDSGGTVLYNEVLRKSRTLERRHKFAYERRSRK